MKKYVSTTHIFKITCHHGVYERVYNQIDTELIMGIVLHLSIFYEKLSIFWTFYIIHILFTA